MTERLKLRTAPTVRLNRDLRIDRAANVIRDVVAMQAGVEATGHGVQADLKTLQMMADLGNLRGERGIKSHFGHTGASENAMGKQIGIARRFYVDGDKLRHDLHFLPPARLSPVFARDPLDYLFDMAEKHPADFGESVVIDADTVWVLSDGREVPRREGSGERYTDGDDVRRDEKGRPFDATTPLPILRPKMFVYCDVVADGALTHDGLFGTDALAQMFSGTPSAYASEVFDLVDRWREEYNIPLADVPRKVNRIVSTYLFARGYEENDMAGKPKRTFEADTPANQPTTPSADEQVIEQPADAEAPGVDDELDAALDTAGETERRQNGSEADEDQPEAEAEASADERSLAAAYARIEALETTNASLLAQNAALVERFEKLARLAVQNTRHIEALDRNIRRIDGDPVVTMGVPKAAPSGALEPLQFEAPRPPLAQALASKPQAPQTGAPGPAYDFDADPERALLEIMAERQRVLAGAQ